MTKMITIFLNKNDAVSKEPKKTTKYNETL